MNTREEIEKIIDRIEGALERNADKSYEYQAGAYEAVLEIVQGDLETICEVLKIRNGREYP